LRAYSSIHMRTEQEVDITEDPEWVYLRPDPDKWNSLFHLSRNRAATWALVLDSQNIPCKIVRFGIGWYILVPKDWLDHAAKQISGYEHMNKGWPPPPPKPNPLTENTLTTLSVLLLLAVFHNITILKLPVSGHMPPEWMQIGSAQAARILDGEWWRLVTSLTLHANWLHLLSNLAIGGFFIIILCRELGSGLAWALLLLSGMLGNLANSHFHLPTHTSVGSSTLIFGGIGILSALSMIRYRHQLRKRWSAPVGGALALLASLGTEGVNSDIGAHFFGFIFGFIIGLVAEYVLETYSRPGKALNALLASLCLITVATAWWLAIINR